MIQLMRSKAATWVARVLAVFLIISFAVWGIEDMFRAPTDADVVADVGPTEIGRNEFSYQFTRVLNTMRSQLGPEFDAEQAARLGLLDQTLNQMINARLITLEANRLGLDAGEEQIRQNILGDERFRGLGDRFDRNRFRVFLSQEGMAEGTYVATLRDRIVRDQVAGAFDVATHVPKILQDTLYRYRNEQRIADVVTIPLDTVADIPEPSDSVLATFHKENPGFFTAPEYRRVIAIYLDPDEIAKGLTPTKDRIQQEFEDRKATLSVPERRTIEQALLQDEEKAKALSQQLKQGRPFREAVEEVTGKPPVSLGNLSQRELPDTALAEAAFSLRDKAASEPIKSALGWHILHVTSIVPGLTPKLENHRAKIRTDLAREMAIDDIIKLTEKLDDTLGGGARLEEAASTVGVRALTIAAIDANGRDPSGKAVAGLPGSPVFLERAFTTPIGENTNVEETRDGGFFVLRVDNITPPALRPLKDVRATAIAEWKKTRLDAAAREKAVTLQTAAKNAGALAPAAKTAERALVTSEPFTRFNRPAGSPVSPELSTALFSARPGEPVIARTSSGYAVAAVTKVLPADPGKDRAGAEDLKKQLASAVTNDAIGQFLTGLRKRYPVEINRAAANSAAGVNTGG